MRMLITLLAIMLTPVFVVAQSGCTDPNAINFDPNAQNNDGSCVYETTYYTPQTVIDPLPTQLEETSGLIYYNGGLWSHNDSGGAPDIFKFDTINGSVVQTISISNGSNVDWEDIAQDNNFIYIGDFGNNNGNRTDLTIYRIPKSAIPEQGNADIEADLISFAYSDQDDFTPAPNNNNFDCEAMLVKDELIYLLSKNWVDQKTKLYAFPKIPGNFIAALIQTYDVNGLITAVDYNEPKQEITLLGYQNYVPFIWLLFDYNEVLGFFSGNKRRIDFTGILGTQTEGLAYSFGKSVFISSESTAVVDQSVYTLNTAQWTDLQPVSVAERDLKPQIVLTPNSASDSFKITLNGVSMKQFEISCFTPGGQKVYHARMMNAINTQKDGIHINVSNWHDGIYFVKISGSRFTRVKKLLVE